MWFLLACVEPDGKPDPADTAAPDSGKPDSGDTAGDTDTDTDTVDTDTAPDTAAEDTDTGADHVGRARLDCTPPELALCDDDGCTLVVEIETASVGGALSLDGDPVPGGWELALAGPTATWALWQWHNDGPSVTHNVREADLYRVEVSGGSWAGRLPLGEWQAFLVQIDGSNSLSDRVPLGALSITGDGTFDVSAARHPVDLSLSVGGVSLGAGTLTSDLEVLLRSADGASHLVDEGDPLSVALPAGEWTASLYTGTSDGGLARGIWALGTFTVPAAGPVVLDADAVAVGGEVTWNSAPTWELTPHAKWSLPWRVTLWDVVSGESFNLDVDAGEPWSTRVPPGTYDVVLTGDDQEGGYGPSGIELLTNATADIAVTTHDWSGTATWLGAPIDGAWTLWFRSEHSEIRATSSGGTWTAAVPEGVWDVWLDRSLGDGAAARVATGVVVAADGTLDADLVDHAVSGTITFAGGDPPDSPGIDDWGISLTDPEVGTYVAVTGRVGQPWEVRVPAGTYDVSMFWQDDAVWESPTTLVASGLVVTGDTTLALEVDAAWVDVAFLLDGAPAPPGTYYTMSLTWTDLGNDFTNQVYVDASETALLLPYGAFTFWGQSDALRTEGTDNTALFGTCTVGG